MRKRFKSLVVALLFLLTAAPGWRRQADNGNTGYMRMEARNRLMTRDGRFR
ncbi:MAG: hypothetical protein ACXVH6_04985 [Halobacteriota archaeon]